MKINYIPEILKEKLSSVIRYFYAISLLLVSILSAVSLITFNINDNSFLSSTSSISNNLLGDFGSYFASLIFYTFGVLGYFIVLFFLVYSFLVFINRPPGYIFIRLLCFFFSLILIPQLFIYYNFKLVFIDSIDTWGRYANNIFKLHNFDYIHYLLSILGLLIFLMSQNIFSLLKINELNFSNFFKKDLNNNSHEHKIKKEPIINNSLKEGQVGIDNIENRKQDKNINIKSSVYSPSLEILETSNSFSKNSIEHEKIKANSILLEKVFEDFNIDIEVVNVKLGPVVTLLEILPAAGIKINTIINLAGDISRSMGVGAVRISQIFGTQYLGVEVPNEKREVVTIKELLSNSNFKNTLFKIT